jgi:short-subunit dehydrogenase
LADLIALNGPTRNTEISHFLFSDGSTEELKKMLDVNVLGLSVCTKEALQSMKERGVDDGHIIHINRFVTFKCIK